MAVGFIKDDMNMEKNKNKKYRYDEVIGFAEWCLTDGRYRYDVDDKLWFDTAAEKVVTWDDVFGAYEFFEGITLLDGDVLVAIDACTMRDGSGDALVVGKEYVVCGIDNGLMAVRSELYDEHMFDMDEDAVDCWRRFFTIKK